jgi:hypothetical protein
LMMLIRPSSNKHIMRPLAKLIIHLAQEVICLDFSLNRSPALCVIGEPYNASRGFYWDWLMPIPIKPSLCLANAKTIVFASLIYVRQYTHNNAKTYVFASLMLIRPSSNKHNTRLLAKFIINLAYGRVVDAPLG